ncbi:MAG: hypothetical protein IVW53_10345 [Chloroflexi bacterium]|nr:hypothetical protein [Chloroflexota bacterium]
MERRIDLQQPIGQTVGAQEPAQRWLRGFALESEGSLGEPARRPYSYLAACECPYDCPRDHENE